MNAAPLTDLERRMLDFEKITWRYAGAKEDAIRERFDLTPTRYYQQLAALIDRPDALTYAPMTVRRLQRLREGRAANRKSSVSP